MNASGMFRKRRYDFTMVSNRPLEDKTLSLKAKGLYAMIEFYNAIPNFTLYKSYLCSMCKEGRDSFNSAWNELKDKGYLTVYQISKEDGKFYYEYELS